MGAPRGHDLLTVWGVAVNVEVAACLGPVHTDPGWLVQAQHRIEAMVW